VPTAVRWAAVTTTVGKSLIQRAYLERRLCLEQSLRK
jgi:hypothetical protein